jgi:hypothetical protein
MSVSLRRGLTNLACRALQVTLPASLQSWGWAVRCEAASIPDDTKALLFTLDSLCGLIPRAVASHLFQPLASLTGEGAPFSEGSIPMTIIAAMMRRPRALGIACAVGAVVLGLVYMVIAGAPARYLGVNVGALAIGLTMLALLGRTFPLGRQWMGGMTTAMAGALLATAFMGTEVEGISRWVRLGGFAIQPSLILLPVMIVAFSYGRSVVTSAGVVAAAAAMALQPDRAMAGMLVLALGTLAIICRDRHSIVALIASIAGFAVTLIRADPLPAVPHVEQVFYSSFGVHVGAGLAVLGGTMLLLVPAIVGWRRDADNRATFAAFGAVWFAAILAAALGNYPTPIVGYGGSAIIGYALSLLALPKLAGVGAGAIVRGRGETAGTLSDRFLLVGLA